MSARRRLIVCLDGTWNQQDDSTNVLHHYNLVVEGEENAGGRIITQKKQYFRGVGTGPLDRITGGGFGFGLEQNVRDAYNWLVEHYYDGEANPKDADEIFIFGFSRGAYTARSLVGFIAMCGLLRRGAPLTVSQLWGNYCILGRKREDRSSFWEKIFGENESVPRQITELALDPWRATYGPPETRRVVSAPRNESERLMVQWSRRAKITYLGVYDTVGAIGWDALAIPGLKSKLALHHNMRPTTLIQNCRHALAINENRSSFQHTPFTAYLGDNNSRGEAERGGAFPKPKVADNVRCLRLQAMWNRKIKQRWFVGAHANIGGGYPDNLLAQRPLAWLVEGAEKAGLICQPFPPPMIPTFAPPAARDSYAEFARPFWTMIFRAKRSYRVIDPIPVSHASRRDKKQIAIISSGYVLKHINEGLDDSVFAYYGVRNASPPPNLVEYARRKVSIATGPYQAGLQMLANRKPAEPWPGKGFMEILILAVWAWLAAQGLAVTDNVFLLWLGDGPPRSLVSIVACLLLFVDWGERWTGFSLAAKGGGAFRRAMLDVLYWLRAVGFVLFVCGFAGLVSHLGKLIHIWIWNWLGLPLLPASTNTQPITEIVRLAGFLLLLQLAVGYFFKALAWVGEPMSDANLGSMVKLQLCATPARVKKCLDDWLASLKCGPDDSAPVSNKRKLETVRAALWRDLVGFIPLYSVVFGFGSWLASTQFAWVWLAEFWFLFPVVAAVADYGEDFSHLRYLSLYGEQKQPSGALTGFSFLMTLIKYAAFGSELLLTFAAIVLASWHIYLNAEASGWRGLLALSITTMTLLVVAGITIWAAIYRAQHGPKLDLTTPPFEKPEYRLATT